MSSQQLTPGAWRDVLEKRLDHRWFSRLGGYDAYYEGDHRLSFATAKFREAFGAMFAALADNWMQIVVDSTAERLQVQGFRFGKNPSADDAAHDIWQANGLDAESQILHTEAIKLEEAYWLVEPPRAGSSDPARITAECPSQMIVAVAAHDHRIRLAALKKWTGEDGYGYCTLYLPRTIHKWRSAGPLRGTGGMTGGRINWRDRPGDPGGDNRLGVVPVIPVRNNPSLRRGGRSDMAVGIPIQDAINKLLSDMLIGSEYQAFPQRVLLGVEIPKDPETGQPIRAAELQASQSRIWAFANDQAKVAEFKAADLKNYVEARQHLIENLTAKTRTPPHYVTGKMINVSGDALKAGETGLVSKTRWKMVTFGEGHEDALRLAFLAQGDKQRAKAADAEVIWRDPEIRSQGELTDSLTKLKALNVPDEILWEKWGFSPTEIARMKTMQIADTVFAPEGEGETSDELERAAA